MKRASVLCMAASLFTGAALAAPVGPGQSINDRTPDLAPPGVQIASKTINWTADVVNLDQDTHPGWIPNTPTIDGSVTTSVWRDSSGKLSFLYDFALPNYDDNLRQLTVTNYAGFSTDVTAWFNDIAVIKRSADGKTITGVTNGGNGAEPHMLVTTDATSFDSGGTAIFLGSTDFIQGHSPNGDQSGPLSVSVTANLSGLYQPAESTAAVPLPPAVYGGMASLAVICGVQQFRKGRTC
jgi:hypothetical protein